MGFPVADSMLERAIPPMTSTQPAITPKKAPDTFANEMAAASDTETEKLQRGGEAEAAEGLAAAPAAPDVASGGGAMDAADAPAAAASAAAAEAAEAVVSAEGGKAAPGSPIPSCASKTDDAAAERHMLAKAADARLRHLCKSLEEVPTEDLDNFLSYPGLMQLVMQTRLKKTEAELSCLIDDLEAQKVLVAQMCTCMKNAVKEPSAGLARASHIARARSSRHEPALAHFVVHTSSIGGASSDEIACPISEWQYPASHSLPLAHGHLVTSSN